MFCFKAGVLLEELKAFILKYMKIKIGLGKQYKWNLDLALSMDIPSISIDYAVMEQSKNKSGILTI
jgi:mannose-1-phosphate guanylyltransferase